MFKAVGCHQVMMGWWELKRRWVFCCVFSLRFLWRCFTMLSLFIQMFFGRVPTSFCKSLCWNVATVYNSCNFVHWLFDLEFWVVAVGSRVCSSSSFFDIPSSHLPIQNPPLKEMGMVWVPLTMGSHYWRSPWNHRIAAEYKVSFGSRLSW